MNNEIRQMGNHFNGCPFLLNKNKKTLIFIYMDIKQ